LKRLRLAEDIADAGVDAAADKLAQQGKAGELAAGVMKNEKVKSGFFGAIKNMFGGGD